MQLVIEPLRKDHDRASFDCGVEPLNRYLKQIARQSADRNTGITHVAVTAEEPLRIVGYYTLLTETVTPDILPEKGLPRNSVPVVLLARLATDVAYQGRGIGKTLLLRALAQAEQASRSIGIFAVVTDAKDETAAAFYARYGFARLSDNPLHLYLPIQTIRQSVIADDKNPE